MDRKGVKDMWTGEGTSVSSQQKIKEQYIIEELLTWRGDVSFLTAKDKRAVRKKSFPLEVGLSIYTGEEHSHNDSETKRLQRRLHHKNKVV